MSRPELEHRLGQLLDEQRHAVGARHDLLEHLGRQRLAARDSFDHRRALAPAEAIERQRRDVRVARPRRAELGPVGEHRQDRQGAHPLDQQVEQLQGRRIDPVQVLVQLEHRAVAGEAGQLLDQDLEGALLLALRAEVQGRVALARGTPSSAADQRHRLVQLLGRLAEQRLQLGELGLRLVVGRKARRPLQLRDDRMERAVGVVGRAEMAEREVRLAAQLLAQRPEQARFADARLAREQHHLAVAVLGPGPALQQNRQLVLAPDQRREPLAVQRLEAALGAAFALDPEGRERLGEALEAHADRDRSARTGRRPAGASPG